MSHERNLEDSPERKWGEGRKGEGQETRTRRRPGPFVKTNGETPCGGPSREHLKAKFLICFSAEFGQAICSVGIPPGDP